MHDRRGSSRSAICLRFVSPAINFFPFFSGNAPSPAYRQLKGDLYMEDVILVLLGVYAVWSARKILALSASLHVMMRILGDLLAEDDM